MNPTVVEIPLPTTNFSVKILQDLYKNGPLKDHLDAVQYIHQYYFETDKGMYYKYDHSRQEFEFKDRKDFKAEVLDKLNDKHVTMHFQTNSEIFSTVSRLDRPRLFTEGGESYVNSCKGFLHKAYKPFDEYDASTKAGVELIIGMMREISCCNDEALLTALLKYYAQLARGQKTQVIIYRKAEEGVGKSHETQFIMDYVLGRDVCLISGTEPLLSNFNKMYMGKVLVVFEELPTFTRPQWEGVSSKLKTFTTENRAMFRDLYEKAVESENLLNFQINTNVEALKDSNGRRIINLTINSSKMKDYAFFDNIRAKCFNNRVGEAFFSYLMTKVNIEGFYAQRDFPETLKKRVAISDRLPSAYKFLKYKYLLLNIPCEKVKISNLYQEYLQYCAEVNIKIVFGRNEFYTKVEDIGIKRNMIDGLNYYSFDVAQLKAIADKRSWICEYDEYTNDAAPTADVSDQPDYKRLYEQAQEKKQGA